MRLRCRQALHLVHRTSIAHGAGTCRGALLGDSHDPAAFPWGSEVRAVEIDPPSSLASNTRTRHKHEQQLNCQQREKMLLKAGCDVRLYFHPATPMGVSRGPGKGSVCPGPRRAAAASAAPHCPALAGCPLGPPLSRCSSLPGRQTPSIVLGCWGDRWTTGGPNST